MYKDIKSSKMGQKVHPIGFRVGITKPYQSQWFARFQKYQYSQTILEDRLLRQTLMTLFPKLLNANISSVKKKEKKTTLSPKITHIKIERGLIPYQIGLHIHAENCQLLKSAIENLKVSNSLETNLQKIRRYLSLLKRQPSNLQNDISQKNPILTKQIDDKKEQMRKENNKNRKFSSEKNFKTMMRNKKRISKKRVRAKSSILTLQKQKTKTSTSSSSTKESLQKQKIGIGSSFTKESIDKKFYFQIGTTKTIGWNQQIPTKGISLQKTNRNRQQKNFFNQNRAETSGSKNVFNRKGLSKNSFLKNGVSSDRSNDSFLRNLGTASWNQTANKIFDFFLKKTKKNFFRQFKEQMKYWNEHTHGTPFGSNKKWIFGKKVITILNNKPIPKLIKLFLVLKKKALVKMDRLRNTFISSGSLSKTQAFGYYQILKFVINLRKYIKKRSLLSQNLKKVSTQSLFNGNLPKLRKENFTISYAQIAKNHKFVAIQQKLANIEEECRKIKFIEYLKGVVKKYRENNIFYYLSTIVDSRKNLRKIQQLTKRNSNFLFGLDSKKPEIEGSSLKSLSDGGQFSSNKFQSVQLETNNLSVIRRQIKQVLESEGHLSIPNETIELSSNIDSAERLEVNNLKTTELQKIFLKQLEKEKKRNKENCELTPKISFKFYTTKNEIIETKAIIVADTVVDALEKRQAFRKVIKQAMSSCMKNPRVKGVKIQVAGRLNGAEIARTEWVRSGRVPLQTLTANIDYSYKTANTIYGIIGIKVWIFKGYTKIL